MKMKNVKIKIGKSIIALVFFVTLISLAKADSYQLYCLNEGQVLNLPALCNPAMEVKQGPLQICMHLLDNGKICPASPNACNNAGINSCGPNNGSSIDTTPPILQINSPIQGSIHTERAILLNLQSSETANIAFIDNLDNRGRWTTICTKCTSSSRQRTFNEGLNDLLFRATDRAGNEGFANLTFFVDTKVPKIKKVMPKSGFTSGAFEVEYIELNPTMLKLHYGNSISGMAEVNVNFAQCTDGTSGSKICQIQANLNNYDNEEIELWADLTDIAGNNAVSPHNILKVDFSKPAIIQLDYPVDGKLVNFHVELNEANPDKVVFIDNLDSRPKWQNLCTGMKTETCNKKVSFKDGNHEVTLRAVDLAGNYIERNISFFTDSMKPKIKKISPMSGFSSGDFEIEFDEQNPTDLILHYGNLNSGMRQVNLNINQECFFDKTYKCLKGVNLNDFNGEEIEYYFDLSDVVGQSTESKHVTLDVDTSFPAINSITHTLSGNRATITLDVTEDFLDSIVYINDAESTPRERLFCSSLTGGKCKKTITLVPGAANVLHFQVSDEAGNSVAATHEIVL